MIQLQVLNYLIQSQDSSMIIMNNIDNEYFSDYPKEFEFVKNHLIKYGKVPDIETFLANFTNFPVINVTERPEYLIEELFTDRNERFLAKTFNDIRELLKDNKVSEAMSLYSNSADQVHKGISLNSVDILKDVSRYEAYIERTQDFTKYYIKTGFKELDEVLGGWDREDDLVTISARPGVGKTWAILKSASAAASQGLNVGIYSGEMSDRMVGYRIDTLLSNISNGCITHGNIAVQNDYKIYIDSLLDRDKGTLKVLTPAMINGAATVSSLRAFIEKDNLDILFIDQHSLLEDERKARNSVDKASNISKDLKTLQSLKKIPIVAVSQQNRASTENGINVSNIAQADRIGQDSSVVIFLEKKDDLLTLHLVKSRYSADGKKLSYKVDFDKGTFIYIPTETDAVNSGNDQEDYDYYYDVAEGEDVF